MGDLPVTRGRTELAREIATVEGIRAKMEELRGLVTATETSLSELEQRGFWKRIFANNTRDTARAMGHVVRVQQHTSALIVAMLQIHARNVQMLGVIRDQMLSLQEDLGRLGSSSAEQADLQLAMDGTLSQLALIVDQKITSAKRERRPRVMALWVVVVVLVAAALGLAFVVRRGGG